MVVFVSATWSLIELSDISISLTLKSNTCSSHQCFLAAASRCGDCRCINGVQNAIAAHILPIDVMMALAAVAAFFAAVIRVVTACAR